MVTINAFNWTTTELINSVTVEDSKIVSLCVDESGSQLGVCASSE